MEQEVKNSNSINLGKNKVNKNLSFQAESPSVKIKQRISDMCRRDGGQYIKFNEDTYGILVAAVEKQNSEFYFVILNKDRKIEYVSTDLKYNKLKEIPANCSVLDYIWMHDRAELMNVATTALSTDVKELFTPIYITLREQNTRGNKVRGNKKYNNNKFNKRSTTPKKR